MAVQAVVMVTTVLIGNMHLHLDRELIFSKISMGDYVNINVNNFMFVRLQIGVD